MRRTHHHLILAGLAGLSVGAAAVGGPAGSALDRVSIVTAYLCLALLCTGLAIGPVHTLRTSRPLLNNYLRRDVGIWAAVAGLVHLCVATVQSMTEQYMATYVDVTDVLPPERIRAELFTWSTIAGLVIGVVLLILLGLSNDRALRWLGTRSWKRLHRVSYVAFVLTVLHGLAFQVLESRTWSLIALVLVASLAVLTVQLAAARAVRRTAQRKAGSTDSPSSAID